MFWYALASLTPAVMLGVAFRFGGVWDMAALLSITLVVVFADRFTRIALPRAAPTDQTTRLSMALALVHFALLLGGVARLAENFDIALFLALGLYFGQISNSNAHELIHKAQRLPRRLGKAVYCSLLFGHHASAHPKVHHVWVASNQDPSSAPLGQGFYRFWPRAWIGSFRAGWRAESDMRKRQNPPPHWSSHPYLAYGLGALITVLCAGLLAGWSGVVITLFLAIYAQGQLILSDYVQHYGLRRQCRTDGRLEPVGVQHSWNAAPWYSSAMMLNAPRHSDHHAHPSRAFPALRLSEDMPMLPFSLPAMGAIALVPPLWRRLMDRRAKVWIARNTGEAHRDLAQ